jgi:hypothetical protein
VTSSNIYFAQCPAKNAVNLQDDSKYFASAHWNKGPDIPHTPNNWIRYEFKKVSVIPTHYTIRFLYKFSDWTHTYHMKSWAAEVSMDSMSWTEIDHKEDNSELYAPDVTRTFQVARMEEGRFIRLVNIGRNHFGNDMLRWNAWEILGSLIE